MKKQRTYKDNRGFSLVELLIAITILAIIVVPLLHTFVSAARTNLKARKLLRITTAAQDVMEGLKANTIEEIAYQFNYPDVTNAANPDIKKKNEFQVIKRSLVAGDIKEIRVDTPLGSANRTYTDILKGESAGSKAATTASMYSDNNGVDYEFLGQTDGKYYFAMADVTLQHANFDALIEIDANPYRAGSSISPTTALHNTEEVVDINRMNIATDAFFVEDENAMNEALTNINTSYSPAYTVTAPDLHRKIIIDVEKGVIGGITTTTVKVTYQYTAKHAGETDIVCSPEENIVFNNSSSQKDLKEIYLFYFPYYNGTTDEIEYNNNDLVPVNLNIVKQVRSTAGSSLQSDENNYKCKLDIYEPGIVNPADSATKLKTNLDTNLYAINTSIALPKLTNVRMYYNSMAITPGGLFDMKDLASSAVKDRIFDIYVHIYDQGAMATGFPEDQRLTTVSGSKDN